MVLGHVCDVLAALHPRLDRLGEHLKDSPVRVCGLLLENGWCDAAELEPKAGLLLVLPLPKIYARSHWFSFDQGIVRVV